MRQLYAKIIDLAGVTKARFSPNYDGAPKSVEFTEAAGINGENVSGDCRIDFESIKDPGWQWQRDLQRLLQKEYRIEIYSTPTFRGVPEWSGVIGELNCSMSMENGKSKSILTLVGNDSSHRLARRYTRQYETLNGNAGTVAQNLLKTYNWLFKDAFNRALLGSDWTVSPGSYSMSGTYIDLWDTGAGCALKTVATYTAAQWQSCKVSFDFKFPTPRATAYDSLSFGFDPLGGFGHLHLDNGWAVNALPEIAVVDATSTLDVSREFLYDTTLWNHIDIFYVPVTGGIQITVDLNGLEVISGLWTTATANASTLYFLGPNAAGTPHAYIDNFIFRPLSNALTVGTFDATSETLTDQETNGMSQWDQILWIANKIGFEVRVNPAAGEGNDSLDFQASVGYDWTATKVLFKETEDKDYPFRIVRCQRNDASEELATVLHTYGQRSEDAAGSFISVDLDAIGVYGEIESQHSDERIIDVATAKVIGDIELAKRSGNTPSYSFTLVDETKLYEQDPVWGYAMWGDFIWGGRTKLRAGDTISVSSESLDLFKEPLKILSLRRQSGTNEVEVTCEFRPWTRQRARQRLEDQLQRAIREAYLKMDTQTLDFALSGTTAQTQSFSIQGNYRSVRIDIHSASWGGAGVAITLDGVDRTARWFGIGSVTANATAREKVMVFLYASLAPGVHTLTLTPTATVTVRVDIRPQVRS